MRLFLLTRLLYARSVSHLSKVSARAPGKSKEPQCIGYITGWNKKMIMIDV